MPTSWELSGWSEGNFGRKGAMYFLTMGGRRGPGKARFPAFGLPKVQKMPMWFQSLQRKTVLGVGLGQSQKWYSSGNILINQPQKMWNRNKGAEMVYGNLLPRPCLWKTEKGLDERMNKAFWRRNERWASEGCSMGDEIQQSTCGVQARRCLL